MINQLYNTVTIIPYRLRKTEKINFYEREAPVMSRVADLKAGENIKSVFFSIFPFTFFFKSRSGK